MLQIGLLSDTHAYLNPKLFPFFNKCDQIWHAGDWGNIDVVNSLEAIKPVTGVYGNIDGYDIRKTFPRHTVFMCEEVKVLMIHIGGYPGKYPQETLSLIKCNQPQLFICGHSHILKVINDPKHNLLHINPGAAGKFGFHAISTALRFLVEGNRISNLEILEMEK